MKDVLHDWDDDTTVAILSNARAAMRDGRLLVAEILVDGPEPRAFGPLFDLMMMTTTHDGRQRAEGELRALFERAGLRLTRVTPTVSPVSVVEGVAIAR